MRYGHLIEAGVIGGLMLLGVSFVTTYDPDPRPGGWQRVCDKSATETTTAIIPGGASSSLAFGAVPIAGGLSIRSDTSTVCQRYAWQCPIGARCDARLKPAETP
jgi:hypothetical protein